MLDKIDTFEVVTSGDFIFKFAKAEAAVLKTYALPLAEEAYKTFSARYGFKPSGPILVEVFPVHDDFAVRTLGLPGLVGRARRVLRPRRVDGFAAGAAARRVQLAGDALARDRARLHAAALEVPRAALADRRHLGLRGTPAAAAWGRELTLEYAHQLAQGKTFGVKGLPEAFKRPESLALAYFEASLVVEHSSS